jgi:hypothetical protein
MASFMNHKIIHKTYCYDDVIINMIHNVPFIFQNKCL